MELKKAAQACMDDILTKIQEQVAAARSHKDTISTIDTQQLKTKVKYAVEAMQEGLVERDTEVRPFEAVCWYHSASPVVAFMVYEICHNCIAPGCLMHCSMVYVLAVTPTAAVGPPRKVL